MKKRTKMIVITKEKIIKFMFMCFMILFLIIICGFAVNKAKSPSPNYKKIINFEITPAKNEVNLTKENKNFSVSILKKYFALGEYVNIPEEKVKMEEKKEEPSLVSESLTIDRGLAVSNNTSYSVNPEDFLNKALSFKIDNSGPQVLIMHTHTTESFSEDTYIKGAPDRNLDENKNITAVGKAMEEVFNRNGIGVVHDKTVHDYPSYNSSYQSAAATIQKNINNYKSIKVVLDVHRDGITREDGTKVKLVTDIDGEKTAQIMLVVGTDTNLPHDKWQENFKFASKIQAKGLEMYPTLMRPIDLRKERFNEQLTTGSIIIEVGSNGNTIEEAVRGGEKISEIISAILKGG